MKYHEMVALIAAIIREHRGGMDKDEALAEAHDYLVRAYATYGAKNG